MTTTSALFFLAGSIVGAIVAVVAMLGFLVWSSSK